MTTYTAISFEVDTNLPMSHLCSIYDIILISHFTLKHFFCKLLIVLSIKLKFYDWHPKPLKRAIEWYVAMYPYIFWDRLFKLSQMLLFWKNPCVQNPHFPPLLLNWVFKGTISRKQPLPKITFKFNAYGKLGRQSINNIGVHNVKGFYIFNFCSFIAS